MYYFRICQLFFAISVVIILTSNQGCWQKIPLSTESTIGTDTVVTLPVVDLSVNIDPALVDLGADYPDLRNAGLTVQIISPAQDYQKGGSTITIFGSGFTLNTEVLFGDNGPALPLSVGSSGEWLKVKLPVNGTINGSGQTVFKNPGLVSVKVTESGITKTTSFRYYIENVSFGELQQDGSKTDEPVPVVADINNDGRKDIIFGQRLIINDGTDVIFSPAKPSIQLPYIFNQITPMDLDGDSNVDLIGLCRKVNPSYENEICVGFGDGKGNFPTIARLSLDSRAQKVMEIRHTSTGLREISAVDSQDALYRITATGRTLNKARNLKGLEFLDGSYFDASSFNDRSRVRDFDADGVDDLYHNDGRTQCGIFFLNSSWHPVVGSTFSVADRYCARAGGVLVGGYFSSDSDRSSIWGYANSGNSRISLLGTITPAPPYENFELPYFFPDFVDVNGDGRRDVAYQVLDNNMRRGNLTFLLGNGSKVFSPTGVYVGISDDPRVLITDINGDNRPDLIFMSRGVIASERLTIRLANGN